MSWILILVLWTVELSSFLLPSGDSSAPPLKGGQLSGPAWVLAYIRGSCNWKDKWLKMESPLVWPEVISACSAIPFGCNPYIPTWIETDHVYKCKGCCTNAKPFMNIAGMNQLEWYHSPPFCTEIRTADLLSKTVLYLMCVFLLKLSKGNGLSF